MRSSLLALCAAAVFSGAAFAANPAGPLYARLPDIPGPDGRWDFASWDAAHGRVLVAHGKDVLLVEPASRSVRSIGEIDGAHAALAIPGGDRVLVSSGHDNTVRIIESVSGTQIASIPVAGDPDATVLSHDGHTAYVMGADSGVISVVDLDRLTETARIPARPGLEVPVLFGDNMLAVNDEGLGEIEIVDLSAGKMTDTIAMPGCKEPTGLAYAPQFGLALSACGNGKAALVDLRSRKVVRLLPIGFGPDTAIWDEARHRFLVPCGKSGSLAVITLGHRGATIVSTTLTETSARTAAFDPARGRLYLPAARFQPTQASKRPEMIAGSFHLVVLSPRSN